MRIHTLWAFALLPLVAYAYEPDRAKNNLAHEFADCAAFYMMFSGTRAR